MHRIGFAASPGFQGNALRCALRESGRALDEGELSRRQSQITHLVTSEAG
jgi:hypothetical protein